MRIKKSQLRRIIREELEIISKLNNVQSATETVDPWVRAGRGEMHPTEEMINSLSPEVTNQAVQTYTHPDGDYTVYYIGEGEMNLMKRKWVASTAPEENVRQVPIRDEIYLYAVEETG